MRLDFNVLWVDDQPASVDAQIKKIKRDMQQEGFEFNPTVCKSVSEVTAKITDAVFVDEIDLILVDWDLGGGLRGYDAIKAIRDTAPYKEVVFYSANTTPKELRQAVFDKELEGIYCASRDSLVEEVVGVFESLVKKVLDLDHTRGIVMGATSDIDFMVQECLKSMHQASPASDQTAMIDRIIKIVRDRAKKLTEAASVLEGERSLDKLLQSNDLFSAWARLRVLVGLLDEQRFAAHVEYRSTVVAYQQEVVTERNKLGHRILVPVGQPDYVAGGDGNTISVERARELRKQILEARQKFRDLLDVLRLNLDPSSAGSSGGTSPE